jgi:L-ascorbate metabolism protein UlaG (beta-lactamase superfamily)
MGKFAMGCTIKESVMYRLFLLAITGFGLLWSTLMAAQPDPVQSQARPQQRVEIQWLNQATFKITSPAGKVIVTDPWLAPYPPALPTPLTPLEYQRPEALGKVDVLLVTHAHADHIIDAPALARLNNIPLWGAGDLNAALTTLGVLPPAQLPRFGVGGRVTPAPGIRVTAVHAEHSSVYVWNNPETKKAETHPAGAAVGFIIELENGFRIWHMGDTGLFSDMKFIAERYRPDVVLIPIGGHFTMDPVDAAYALREWIKPKFAIPMHYNTNPFNRGSPEELIKALGDAPVKVLTLKPGERAQF